MAKTVWVKNLKTGLVWLVDAEHAARLLESGEYERAKGERQGRQDDAKGAKHKRQDAEKSKGAKGERRGAKKGKGAKKVR